MTPDELTRKLVLEAPGTEPDGLGGQLAAWTALGTHWARVSPARGRDRSRGALALGAVPAEIVVRGAPEGAASRPVPGQRFREGARIWRVIAVAELDDAGSYLRCDAVEEAVQ
ncbi:head-tail adaptor protein [Poseidonocella sp. HB161398]|uniref:head-tail adaptor protein n=1 Tax=Poseidonocella sp. HB161398 TaxID=2320855 RepID=UPI001109763B|nr:head-tail adaptor protein [Poseidonocella sp. HB161398]